MKQKFSMAISLAVILSMLLTSLVLADNLVDNATSAGLNTITAGDSTTITYQLIANNAPSGDPAGCDATLANQVTVVITKPAAVSGPSSFSFTGCGNPNKVLITFSSSTAGSYNISHTISGGVSGSQFNNNADFTLTVNAATPTNQPPSLGLPANITAEATGASGAVVNYIVTASDPEDGALTPSCSPASGSTFAIGTAQVDCSVTDSDGAETTGMFNVTVQDTTGPVLSLPGNITAEATGPDGAAVSYTATALDAVDGAVTPSCSPASGSTFALGTTTVNCSATDAHSNTSLGSFTVTVQDTTAPAINCGSADGLWHNDNVTISCTASDLVGLLNPADASFSLHTSVAANTEDANASTNNYDVYDAAGNYATAGPVSGNKVDKKAPQLFSCDSPDGAWHNNNVTLNCSYTDGGSGAGNLTVALTTSVAAGSEDANAAASAGGAQSCDAVDNCATSPSDISGNKVDRKAPTNIAFVGSINNGDTYYFSFVPAAPTCTAVDGGSGLVSCIVTGYSTAVGLHTLTATATDNVGNFSTATLQYTVSAWRPSGFYQPVDMSPDAPTTIIWNTVRNGSTVPLKFELFAGATELSNTSYVVQPLRAVGVTCGNGTADDIELTATGGTSLRYDATGGQFIYNWQTPRTAGACYKVTVSFTDGSSLSAYFKLK
jgi:hypothetical protein